MQIDTISAVDIYNTILHFVCSLGRASLLTHQYQYMLQLIKRQPRGNCMLIKIKWVFFYQFLWISKGNLVVCACTQKLMDCIAKRFSCGLHYI